MASDDTATETGAQADDELDRVMVDIETLGTDPGAVILSIGAVRFGPNKLGSQFYAKLSIASCQRAGLTVDGETLEWWREQDAPMPYGAKQLEDALLDFSEFLVGSSEVWAYSPAFDCAILKHAYEVVDLDVPWHYQNERDCRTLAVLPQWPDDIKQQGTEHDALDDAVFQARATASAPSRLEGVDMAADSGREVADGE